MATVDIKITGEMSVRRLFQALKKAVKKTETNMQKPLNAFVSLWKQKMPTVTGFMKSTSTGVVERKGSARAFTKTFGKGGHGKGYAIFPELATQPKAWKSPHFTLRSVEEFAPRWQKDIVVEIDKALRTR